MGAKKYKVEQNGKFLGHYPAHDPKEAVGKAIDNYEQWCDINKDETFVVTRGQKVFKVVGV